MSEEKTKKRINGKTKGSVFEREIMNVFKKMGYYASTSRLSSKNLDNCKIDVIGTPFLIQCKTGYDGKQFKYYEEYEVMKKAILEIFNPVDAEKLLRKPHILIHKQERPKGQTRRLKQHTTVTMNLEDFLKIIQDEEYKKDTLSILG